MNIASGCPSILSIYDCAGEVKFNCVVGHVFQVSCIGCVIINYYHNEFHLRSCLTLLRMINALSINNTLDKHNILLDVRFVV